MSSFQALLLAAALGWNLVGAVPHNGYGVSGPSAGCKRARKLTFATSGPLLPYAPANTTTIHHSHDVTVFAPRTETTQSSLILPSYWNVSRITAYPSPVIESSESSLDMPTLTPHTERTRDSLQVPGGTTTYSTAYVPTTERTQDSLEVPTGVTTYPTLPPVPIVRTERSQLSLEVPTRHTTTAAETRQPKPHTERPASGLDVPYSGDTSVYASAEVKTTRNELVPGQTTVPATAHLELSRTALGRPTALPQDQEQPQGQPGQPSGPAQIVTYFVGGTPVVAGSPATVIGGTTYAVATSGNAVYVNGVASPLAKPSSIDGIAAVILGVLGAAGAGIDGASSIVQTQEIATQGHAAATTSESLITSASTASKSSTARPAVQTTNVAAGLMLPGLGLGAVAFIAAFL